MVPEYVGCRVPGSNKVTKRPYENVDAGVGLRIVTVLLSYKNKDLPTEKHLKRLSDRKGVQKAEMDGTMLEVTLDLKKISSLVKNLEKGSQVAPIIAAWMHD